MEAVTGSEKSAAMVTQELREKVQAQRVALYEAHGDVSEVEGCLQSMAQQSHGNEAMRQALWRLRDRLVMARVTLDRAYNLA